MTSEDTRLIAHLDYPAANFRVPMIYSPWFVDQQVGVRVVLMGVRPGDYATFIPPLFTMTNIIGAPVTMPHKVVACDLAQRLGPMAATTGACNAIRREAGGNLFEDMFDGDGLVLGLHRKGFNPRGTRALVVGNGGVELAVAAPLMTAGAGALTLYDTRPEMAHALVGRLHQHYPQLDITLMQHDPVGRELVVNATPLGMRASNPLPLDVNRLTPGTQVGEIVMTQEYTPLLGAAQARQCHIQRRTDILFEMIPAHLHFFDLPIATPEQLHTLAEIRY